MSISADQAQRGESLADIAFSGAERFADRPAQQFKRGGEWLDLTYVQLRDVTVEIALGLIALGVRPGDRVCVLSETRPEWTQVEFGIAAAGAGARRLWPERVGGRRYVQHLGCDQDRNNRPAGSGL